MRRTSFMADQDVADTALAEQRIVNRQHCTAGIAEYEFDPLPDQAFNQDAGAAALLAHVNNPSFALPLPLTDRPGAVTRAGSPLQLGAKRQELI